MKILVVNFMQIGDLILTTPVFRALRNACPDAFLAAAVNKAFAELVSNNPCLNQVFQLDKSSWKSFFSLLRQVRALHFDLCINLNRSERASAFAALSGAKSIIGYAKPPFSFLFNEVLINKNQEMHQVFAHFRVLNVAGFTDLKHNGLEIFLPKTATDFASNFFCKHFPANAKVIAFNIGASWSSKRWPPHYFAQVAESFLMRGFHVVFLGSKSDLPLVNLCTSLIINKSNLHIFTGRFSLIQLAAFFDHCYLLITNDSGPMHIAVARNLPSVSVFGSSPVTGFFPFANNHYLIKSPAPCHPCRNHSCKLLNDDFMTCMFSVPPSVVFFFSLLLLSSGGFPDKKSPQPPCDYYCNVVHLDK